MQCYSALRASEVALHDMESSSVVWFCAAHAAVRQFESVLQCLT